MMKEFKAVLFISVLFLCQHGFAQKIVVSFIDTGKIKSYKISKIRCEDSVSIQKALSECLLFQYRKGFLTASIDSIIYCDSSRISVTGALGLRYQWAEVKPDSATNVLLNNIGIREPSLSKTTVNPKRLAKYINLTLHQLEDNGYPFAKVKLNNVKINQNKISADLKVDKGSYIVNDTIYLKGDAKLTNKKLAAIINIKKGEPYSETKVKRFDQRLKQQQYIEIIKPPEIEFLSRKARVYCYLNNKMASRFWGLAGFYSDKTDKKIKLNGELNLLLVNSLRNGERINFAWSAPGKGTQKLNVSTDWPFIFGKQVGFSGSFSIFRQDSTYITINPKMAISFFAPNGGRFMINIDYKKTSYTLNDKTNQSLYANTSAFLYGLGYEYSSYENLILPTKGIHIRTNLNTGTRSISQEQSPKSNLIDGELFIEGYIPLQENRFILALRSNSKARAIYNTNGSKVLYSNEMYLIGGMGTIRGFNQETVLTDKYSIASVELHLRFTEGSGIYLFGDKGYVNANELGKSKDYWPLGVGIGLNMVTKAGLFNLSYALGQGFGQSIGIKDAKVHFGVVATF